MYIQLVATTKPQQIELENLSCLIDVQREHTTHWHTNSHRRHWSQSSYPHIGYSAGMGNKQSLNYVQ